MYKKTVSVRRLVGLLAATVLFAVAFVQTNAVPARAQVESASQLRFFRIGTGSAGGTYFAVGGVIANAISHPPGSRPCERGGSCGVEGLIAVAQSTNGSVYNVQQIRAGNLESALVQADIAYWAWRGEGNFAADGGYGELRAIANLYPEAVHVVVRRTAGITAIDDLRGKRVSLGEEGSGTLIDAQIVLEAYGLGESDLEARYLSLGAATAELRAGELDAFFFVSGFPAPALVGLAEGTSVTMLQISGPTAIALREQYPFLHTEVIPTGAYPGVLTTQTLAVGAQWVVSASQDEELIYRITRALWHPVTQNLLRQGHEQARRISIQAALNGLAIPLHLGAARYYREAGLITGNSD